MGFRMLAKSPGKSIVVTVPSRAGSKLARTIYENVYQTEADLVSLDGMPTGDLRELLNDSEQWLVYREHHRRVASNYYTKHVDLPGTSWRNALPGGLPYDPMRRMFPGTKNFIEFVGKVGYELGMGLALKDSETVHVLDPHIAPYSWWTFGEKPDKAFHISQIPSLFRLLENIFNLKTRATEDDLYPPRGAACNNYLTKSETIWDLSGIRVEEEEPVTSTAPDSAWHPVYCPFQCPDLGLFHQDILHMVCSSRGWPDGLERQLPHPDFLWSEKLWSVLSSAYSQYDAEIVPEAIDPICRNPLAGKLPPLRNFGNFTILGPEGESTNVDWSHGHRHIYDEDGKLIDINAFSLRKPG